MRIPRLVTKPSIKKIKIKKIKIKKSKNHLAQDGFRCAAQTRDHGFAQLFPTLPSAAFARKSFSSKFKLGAL